ncbi:hypothetical protein [Rhizobacter sp. LjRoot28]|uniref:hypothetical protein n=1 Tax=Rhizobacter sp. LjRoot28 TaxID=3342309 RepID=UPI003ED0DE38
MFHGRRVAGVTDQPGFDLEAWPDLDVGALDDQARAAYANRKAAVRLYFAGATAAEIRDRCGLGVRQVNRLILERCCRTHPDGRLFGWRGLHKHSRIAGYKRIQPVKSGTHGTGTAGALHALLAVEVDFARRFEKHILKQLPDRRLGEVNRPIHSIWSWFLQELRKLGYEMRNQWPFDVEGMGYFAVRSHVKRVLDDNPAAAARQAGAEMVNKRKAGDGTKRPHLPVFGRVEMDAHKLDGRFCVLLPTQDGGWVPKIVHRIWVIVVLEIASRAVIGYYLSLRREVNSNDVLRTIKACLVQWCPRHLPVGGKLEYLPGAALPSAHDSQYLARCWDEMSVDGAMAETCQTVRSALEEVVRATLLTPSAGFSSRRSKDDRPFIETYFRTLGERGLQRLSNTTGPNTKVLARSGRKPEKVAVAAEFTWQYAADLLDVLIANYNATPHLSLGHRSPLQSMDYHSSQAEAVCRTADRNLIEGLLSVRKLCVVKGGTAEGRLPYVNFFHCRYTNEVLASQLDLVGKKIWVINSLEDDARLVQASTEAGVSLGVLRAFPPWHRIPHSLGVRSAVQSLISHRRFHLSGGDAITAFCDYVEANARGKLPVHPAYLEIQRILAQHQARSDVSSDVKAAKARLDERHAVSAIPIPDVGDIAPARPLEVVQAAAKAAIQRPTTLPLKTRQRSICPEPPPQSSQPSRSLPPLRKIAD